MFTIDTVVDQYTKTAKQALSYVQDKGVKKEFEALVDAQAAYSKTMFNTSVELAKMATESVKNVDVKAFDFSKLFATK
jgi:hypothetical protein